MSNGTPNYYFTAMTARRREAAQAQQVAIYRIKKDGNLCAKPTVYEPAERVAARIADLEALNPGNTYTTKDAR